MAVTAQGLGPVGQQVRSTAASAGGPQDEPGADGPGLSLLDHPAQGERPGPDADLGVPRAAGTGTPRHGASTGDPRRVLERYQRLAVLGDMLAALLASLTVVLARFALDVQLNYLLVCLAMPLAWPAAVGLRRAYEQRFLGTGPEEYRRVLDAGLLLVTGIAVLAYALHEDVSRSFVFTSVPLTVVLTLMVRHRLRRWIYRLRTQGLGLQRVLVVGRADAAVAVVEKLDHEPQHGLVPVGACVPFVGVEVSHVHGVPVMGDPTRVLEAVDRTGAHVVAVVSHPDMSGHALRRLSWALEERGVELIVSPGIIEVAGPRLSIRPVAGLSLLHMERPAAHAGRMLAKAVFDRVLATLLVLLSSPLLLGTALAVRLTSRGPALFRQIRVGIDGREFTMYKFRSMVVDAEKRLAELAHLSEGNDVLFKMRHDPRVTKVGAVIRRFSVDELPQLLNVVKGDMSLVGPRPPLPQEVAAYSGDATRRLRVRPGVTGLWQVSGRSDLSWEESLRLDLRYADNWTIALDLSILWKTFRAVVGGSGAY